MLETVYIGDRNKKAMAERSFRMKIVFKNTIPVCLGLVIAGLGLGGNRIRNYRGLAHACPDLKKEIKLIDKITEDAKTLQRALKQMVFDQKNGHK